MGVREFRGVNRNHDRGSLHQIGWQSVTVTRPSDDGRNVGVTSELDPEEVSFSIQARIDPLEKRKGVQYYIGLVEEHLLPMMRKGDRWNIESPNPGKQVYRVTSVYEDEIELERL